MADTTFVSKVTTITTAWVQAVNDFIYRALNPLYVTSTGAANAYVITLPGPSLATTLADGARFLFKANFTNTGASTLTVVAGASIGPYPLQLNGNALVSSDILSGTLVEVALSGATWQVLSLPANRPSVSSYMQTVLIAATAAAARTLLGAVGLTGNEVIAGNKTFTGSILAQGAVNYTTAAGTNTYTATLGLTALTDGVETKLLFTNANTGASTLQLDGLAVLTLLRPDGSALLAGDISAGWQTTVRIIGTNGYLQNTARESLTVAENVRQTVLTGATDSNGQANFLSAGAGLSVTLLAASTPVVLTAAAGDDSEGQINYRKQYTADQTSFWAALATSNVSYLMAKRDPSTGVWSAYQTLIPPQYGVSFDRAQMTLLHLNGAMTDEYGNNWANTNGTFVSSPVKFGTNSWQGNGVSASFGTTVINSIGSPWEISGWFYINALPAPAARAALVSWTNAAGFGIVLQLFNNAGTTKLEWSLSSTGTSADIASAVVGTNTTWNTGQWHRFRLLYDSVAGQYKCYLSLNGAAESLDLAVASTSRINGIAVNRFGATVTPANFANVNFDEIRYSPCCRNSSAETPPAAAFTPDAEWFDLSTSTWKFGSTSSWTTTQQVVLGEVTTGAATVTSIATYALQGKYVGPWTNTLPGITTVATQTTNLGIIPVNSPRVVIENLTADQGYNPTEQITTTLASQSSTTYLPIPLYCTKNQVGFTTGNTNIMHTNIKGGGASGTAVVLTAASWRYRLIVTRGW